MKFEETKNKKSDVEKVNKLGRKSVYKDMESIGTGAILFYIVKRHKFGLLVVWAAVFTALYFVPFLPDLMFSFIGR